MDVISVLAGAAMGYLAGLGIGGGSLLILWLTLVKEMPQATARSINLMFFIASALAVSLIRWKKGHLHLKAILPAIIAGCICAGIFSFLGNRLDVAFLQKAFGVLLLVTGIRELLYKPK